MLSFRYITVTTTLAIMLGFAPEASADTFRCVDEYGHATYTNVVRETKGQTCTLIMREIGLEPTNTARDQPIAVPSAAAPEKKSVSSIPLQRHGGAFVVPVLINNTITLNFVVDSGASDVSVPADVVMALMQAGTLTQEDFVGAKTYTLADGSKMPSQTFHIRSMMVGDRVIENVTAGVAPMRGILLLGQSFLRRFKSWSVDNENQALLLE